MKKLWLVAITTYKRKIRSGSFLLLTFGLPVLMIIAGAIPILQLTSKDLTPVGIVDQTGELTFPEQVQVEEDRALTLRTYPSSEEAEAAVFSGEIGGYLLIGSGYFTGEIPTYYAEKSPNELVSEGLQLALRRALLPDAPDWQLARLNNPTQVSYIGRDSGDRIDAGPGLVIRVVIPVGLGILFTLMVFTNVSQMGPTVVQEKDQRSMEMIITSLRPRDLVAGKVLGMTLLSITQIVIWLVGGAIAAGLALSGTLQFSDLLIPWNAVAWALILGLPAYFLFAVLAAGLGIIAGDKEQAQQLASVLGLIGTSPLWLLTVILQNPDGPLSLALTLFPLTSPMFALFRMTLTEVPVWQLATAAALILTSLAAGIWAVTRIFRAAMLMYGQALTPRQIWKALRHA